MAGVAQRLGFHDLDATRPTIHAAVRGSDQDITAAEYGHLLDLDGRAPSSTSS